MRSHEVDLTFRSACQVVVRFKKQYGIPWLRFEQLRQPARVPNIGLRSEAVEKRLSATQAGDGWRRHGRPDPRIVRCDRATS